MDNPPLSFTTILKNKISGILITVGLFVSIFLCNKLVNIRIFNNFNKIKLVIFKLNLILINYI